MKNLALIFGLFFGLFACQHHSEKSFRKTNSGIEISISDGTLFVDLLDENIAHVYTEHEGFREEHPSLSVIDTVNRNFKWALDDTDAEIRLITDRLIVAIDKKTKEISYLNTDGSPLLLERERDIEEDKFFDEDVLAISQDFLLDSEEAIYGLGQNQLENLNLRGQQLRLVQMCNYVFVPVIVSSKNYGIFWDNPSMMHFSEDNNRMNLTSEAGNGMNYYFIHGQNLDDVVAGYRSLTGQAPLYPKWAYGYFQSKEHYRTQEEVENVVSRFRDLHFPMDVIVQDWRYWDPQPWGSHYFDRERYPDPEKMIEYIHEKNAKIMISVWAMFDTLSPNRTAFDERNMMLPMPESEFGFLEENTKIYDAFNPAARELYWKQLHDSLYVKGVDAWWQDATEPEIGDIYNDIIKKGLDNHLGSGVHYLNAFPLMATQANYEGQRKTTSDKRVYILTRSAFAGNQRHAATTWSGDIYGTWDVLRKQISSGLNFCYTGIPYWTSDIGGFLVNLGDGDVVNYEGGSENDSYRELFVRWYQFGAFSPIFRAHGSHTPREPWEYGEKGSWAYEALLKAANLRYRLMPYLYSLGWKVTDEDYTIMRGLAFDFPVDKNVYDINDQYMFGPAFLVNPVTKPMYHTKEGWGEKIPPELLFTDDNTLGGLTGHYYSGTNFDKEIFSRTDSVIHFDWWYHSPSFDIPVNSYSIRWTGKIKAPYDGVYTFVTTSNDISRLWINDELVVEDKNPDFPTDSYIGKIELKADTEYDIKYEYVEGNSEAFVNLRWFTPQKVKPEVAKTRKVYLPENTLWYDFWTGLSTGGGTTVTADATIDILPLFVKAGSIVPMGPFIEWVTQKPSDPLEIRIYKGANGNFTLYEDENDNYNYEKGIYSTIDFRWDDNTSTLIIGDRKGSFEGMLERRVFNIVLVEENHGNGLPMCPKPDMKIEYNGQGVSVSL